MFFSKPKTLRLTCRWHSRWPSQQRMHVLCKRSSSPVQQLLQAQQPTYEPSVLHPTIRRVQSTRISATWLAVELIAFWPRFYADELFHFKRRSTLIQVGQRLKEHPRTIVPHDESTPRGVLKQDRSWGPKCVLTSSRWTSHEPGTHVMHSLIGP